MASSKDEKILKSKFTKELTAIAKTFAKKFNKQPIDITRNFYRKMSKLGEAYDSIWGSFSIMKEDILGKSSQDPKFTRDSITGVKNDSSKKSKRRYFVTAAIAGQSINRLFLASIESFCALLGAELVILPMYGVLKKDEEYPDELKQMADHMVSEYIFNSNLRAFDVMLKPQHVIPLTGLPRLGQKNSSIIVASPKQQMRVVPISNRKLPHIIHSTGCINIPDTYTYTRIGVLGRQDHIQGGLIVEIQDDEIFHIRQVQADDKGGFSYLNKYYQGDKVEDAEVEAFVLGDYHAGFHDESAVKAWLEVTELCNPKHLLLHDLFDGYSISHHHENDLKVKVNLPEHVSTLERELATVSQEIRRWQKKFPKLNLVVVRSNHDEHLDRYLTEGRFIKDPANLMLSLDLAKESFTFKNPLEEYLRVKHGIENVRWLKRDEDFKVAGIQLGRHGDKGMNGARGSVHSTELAFGRAVVGHAHTPQIFRETWVVGTTSIMDRDYMKGHPSSWLHTSCLVYKNGQRSLVTSISGNWRI